LNAVTKSGTNQLHGDLFEFLRHHSVNATNPFNATKADGTRKDDGLKRNQYGGTLGGPIRTTRSSSSARIRAPTAGSCQAITARSSRPRRMLTGDFTTFASPACNGGSQIKLNTPFVDNRIDPKLFSPAALAITLQLPKADDACGRVSTLSRPTRRVAVCRQARSPVERGASRSSDDTSARNSSSSRRMKHSA